MKSIFVTGTDTGVGKTVITGLIARYLSDKGFNVVTQKWVETGCRDYSLDVTFHLKAMRKNRRRMRDCLKLMSPYIFKHASSPHLASKIEHKMIEPEKIINSFKSLSAKFDFVIVEGAGGALVPIDDRNLLIDIAVELNIPFLIVAGNKLGAINHTLLTIEALKRRGIKILGVVFNNLKGQDRLILNDNPRIIRKFSQARVLGVLNREPSFRKLCAEFSPIGKEILKKAKI